MRTIAFSAARGAGYAAGSAVVGTIIWLLSHR
jgi:hypothetical protein